MMSCDICFNSETKIHCCFSMCYDCYNLYHDERDEDYMIYYHHEIVNKYLRLMDYNKEKMISKEKKIEKREVKFQQKKKKQNKICDLRGQIV